MAQHDYVIANGTGAAVRSDLNNALAAIVSQNSGATEPATTYAFQFWADTTTGTLKLRNSANSAWIELLQLDGTLTMEDGTEALPGLSFRNDLDTGLWRPGTNQLAISTNAVERVEFGASEVVFNDGGANYDFRVEGDTNANLLFVDASADAVGIGTSSPSNNLHVVGDSDSGRQLRLSGGSSNAMIKAVSPNRTFSFGATTSNFTIYDDDAAAHRLFINSSGNVGIGTQSPGYPLTVVSDASTQVLKICGRSSDNISNIAFSSNNQGTDYAFITAGPTYLATSVNGSERARIDSSGRLLVGTSTNVDSDDGYQPSIQVAGIAAKAAISIARYQASNPYGAQLFLQRSKTDTIGAQSIMSSGDEIGLIQFEGSDGTKFRRAAGISAQVDGTPGSGDMPGRLVFSTTKDGASSPSERLRIDNLGRTSINQTSATDFGALNVTYNSTDSSNQPATGVNITQSNANTGTMMGFRNSAGTVIGTITNNNNGTITYNNSSDYRLKENIVDLDGAIERLQSIPVRRFNFIGFPDKTVDGFVAHEIQDVVPEAVTGTKDAVDDEGNPIYQGIDQSKLVPLLTAALQEAVAKIESLEARLTTAGI